MKSICSWSVIACLTVGCAVGDPPPDDRVDDAPRHVLTTGADGARVQAAAWALADRAPLADADVDALQAGLDRAAPGGDAAATRTIVWALSLRPDRFPIAQAAELAASHADARVRRSCVRGLAAHPTDPAARAAVAQVATADANVHNRREAAVLLHLMQQVSP